MSGTDSTWHVDVAILERYRGGLLDAASSFSVETHLVACAGCRGLTAGLVPGPRLQQVWDDIVDRIDTPDRTAIELLLLRAGVREEVARLLAGVPALTVPWLSGVAFVLAFAVFAAHARPVGAAFFLVVAAILPLVGIATAYGPGLDPMYEVGIAAPLRGTRLLLIRSVAVLAVSTAACGLAAAALPGLDWTAVAWLLPSLALTLTGLAAGTFTAPVYAAASVAAGWVVLVAGVALIDGGLGTLFGQSGQVGAAGLAALAASVLFARRDRVERSMDVAGWEP